MNITLWLVPLLAFALAIFGFVLLLLAQPKNQTRQADLSRRYKIAFGEEVSRAEYNTNPNWLENVGNKIIGKRSSVDNEIKVFLVQGGWKRNSDVAIFYALQALFPITAVPLAAYSFFVEGLDQKAWSILFIVACAAFLLPKRVLAYLANARRDRITKQTPVLVHLLRVLLGTGLSIEQALHTLSQEARALLPDLSEELVFIIRRVEAGEDLSYAMTDTARQLDVPSFTDLARILEQTWRLGGSILKSLGQLSELIESRLQSDLKEKVSKLSAKMTVVMMVFLFPALMIFLAAPGFLAIVQGLKHVG
ncbi:MAG: type II secretion system F family protein [Gammaproteobacteria bacterium]